MKRLIFLVVLFLLIGNDAYSQKFGYVDTNFILSKMSEYKEAQVEIENVSKRWQEEIHNMYMEIEAMYNEYKAEEVLLTNEMKEERLGAIKKKEEEVKEYQKKVFGFEGLFFLKKQELMKPVQDKVFDAVEKVAKEKRLQIVFDKSGDLVMIYTDPIHDYTDFVLEELGLGDDVDTIR
jgi:outer membrane protein